MDNENEITAVLIAYPRIYMACHTEHIRAASSEVQLSSRDSAVLSHLTDGGLSSPSKLARHLKISNATLSEAIVRLSELGYVQTEPDQMDGRKHHMKLTAKGVEAMKKASVLNPDRVALLLSKLTSEERKQAVMGISLLAKAALQLSETDTIDHPTK